MAEVKSTLELVMERTRHLTLTDEDRREQALAEFKKSLSGLLARFQDGTMRLDQFQADLLALQEHLSINDQSMIIGEIAGRLDLDGDHAWALKLLEAAGGMDIQGIRAVLEEYREAVAGMTRSRVDEMRRDLLERHGISGSAVLPHLTAHPGWSAERQLLRERFGRLVVQEAAKQGPFGSNRPAP